LIAVARGCAPGIDIERLRNRPHAMEIAARFFHPAEAAALAHIDQAGRSQAFLALWTGKEAVLKATGRGIAFGLHRLQLATPPAAPRVLWLEGDEAAQWQLHPLAVGSDHVASLAWRGAARAIEVHTLADSG
jgi:4'-phosphopantetheinyl transferase